MRMHQHEVARRAAEAVTAVGKRPQKERDEHKSFCEGFPVLLRNAGLLQAVVFLEAKRTHPHGTLLEHLKAQFLALGLLGAQESLSGKIAGLDSVSYMTWTRLADRVAYWEKRFVQALLKKDDPNAAAR